MDDILQSLNEAQKKAVLHTSGPLLVLAGAGAGKTRVIVSRIAHLIHTGVAPHAILAITFTNKAAKEMKERVHHVIGNKANIHNPIYDPRSIETPFVSTFHSLGVYLLKSHAKELGLSRHFSILDRNDSIKIIKRAMETTGVDPKQWEPKKILSVISKEKGRGTKAHAYGKGSEFSFVAKVVSPVWIEYEKLLRKEQALDFDDLLVRAVELLEENEALRRHYQNTWKYIHIDEYQDTNTIQYKMGRLLLGPENNICVVGDGDQSIYTWRGANIQNILDFENDFPNSTTVLLEENYRSSANIIRAAQDIIEKNTLRKEKTLFTKNTAGEKLSILFAVDETDEGDGIAHHTQNLIAQGISPHEIAILYRTNFQSRALEEAMIRHSIPYDLVGTRFFQRKEIKDALSYIRLALNPESITDLMRIINTPRRGIGKTTFAKLMLGQKDTLTPAIARKVDAFWEIINSIRTAIETQNPSEVMKDVLRLSGLTKQFKKGNDEDEERIANLQELVTFALKFDHYGTDGIEKMLEDTSLQSDQDTLEEAGKGVRLMTVHASKGLEFDCVFITGLEEGLFPQQRDKGTQEETEEERRLFYVALTRARKKVYLTHASSRTIFGSRNFTIPSDFLSDIDEELLEEDESGYERAPKVATIYLD